MAALAPPPAPRIATAANCDAPVKVVSDMATGATGPQPAARARTPNDTPKDPTAMLRGRAALSPARKPVGEVRGATSPGFIGLSIAALTIAGRRASTEWTKDLV